MYLLDFFRLVPRRRKIKISRKKGVILNNPSGAKKHIFYISNLVLLAGLGMVIFVLLPVTSAWIKYKTNPDEVETVSIETGYLDVKPGDSLDEFRVLIPKISAEANVVANVDVTDRKTFDKILANNNVALSTGSGKPGDGKGSGMYIFAHSTIQNVFGARQNAIFYLLNEIELNDEIKIIYKGNEFIYRIFDKKIVSSDETAFMNYRDENKEIVTLQTCWPLGTNWRRLLVMAEKI